MRGHRFQGFTPEGLKVLPWAYKLEHLLDGMLQEAALCNNRLTGTLRIGAIPTALPIIHFMTEPYQAMYPDVSVRISSLSTDALFRQLDQFELDLGVTYLGTQELDGFMSHALYQERHVLLARTSALPRNPEGNITWAAAAKLPLCLLTPDMQNRRIIDAAFRKAHSKPNVSVETDSIMALYTYVRCSGLFSIVPHSLLSLFELRQEVVAIPLEPELNRTIGLIARSTQPVTAIAESAWQIATQIDLQTRFDALIDIINHQITTSN
jgi:DNA-binding transcriptional LysR family regulator